MSISLLVAYSLIALAPLTLLYVTLVFFEYTRNNQFASDIRLYLDEQIITVLQEVREQFQKVTLLYRSGNRAVKDEIIDPIAEPFVITKEHYTALKTGRRSLAGRSQKRLSPHLKELSKELE